MGLKVLSCEHQARIGLQGFKARCPTKLNNKRRPIEN